MMSSLRARIIALIILTCGLLVTGITVTVYQVKLNNYLKLTIEREVIDVHRQSDALTLMQQQRQLSLESLATRIIDNHDRLNNPSSLQALLRQPSVANEFFPDGLLIFDADATAIAESRYVPGRIGTNYRDRKHFQKAIQTKAAVISEPLIGRATGLPLISFLQPVLSEKNDILGYVGGILDLSKSPLLPRNNMANETRREIIIDPTHRMFVFIYEQFTSPQPLPAEGQDAFVDAALQLKPPGTIIHEHGKAYLVVSKQLDSPNWIISKAIPYNEAIAPAKASFRQFLAITLGIAFFIICVAIWLARNVTRPIETMTRQIATMMNEKNLNHHFPQQGSQEVKELALAMNRLSDEQAQARELINHNKQLLANVLSAASEIAIIATNKDGVITLFNTGAENMLGYTADELINQHSPALFHLESEVQQRAQELTQELGYPISEFQVFIINAEQKCSEKREWTYRHKSGRCLSVSLIVTAIRNEDDSIVGYLGVAQDITEQQRVDNMKSEFISTVSHELRTPLTSISGALSLLLGGKFGDLTDKAHSLLTTAHRNSLRLAHLINDLLDIEKITAGKLDFDIKPQSLASLLRQALEANQHYGSSRNIHITLDLDDTHEPMIAVDEQRFVQIMANLLSNAIKFSPSDEVVTVSLTTNEDTATISVIDRGAGIPVSFHDRIFQRFSQADGSDTRSKEGSGLGLAITKELVEKMQGSIAFESSEGHGSRFYIEFPLLNNEPKTELILSNHDDRNQPRILVVEDDLDVANLLAIMLTDSGYQVDQAHTGTLALNMLATTNYDLLSLDLMLPDISGLDIIRQIRSQARTEHLPIVVVSAKMEQGRIELNGDATGIEWLAKPIQKDQLTNLVNRQLLSRQQHRIRLLHVEDDNDLQHIIHSMMDDRFEYQMATSLHEARQRLQQSLFDLVLLDIGLPDGSGWTLIPDIHQLQPEAKVVILSGIDMTPSEITQVEGVLLKSRINQDDLISSIEKAIASRQKSKDDA